MVADVVDFNSCHLLLVLSDQRKRSMYDVGFYDPQEEEDEGFADFMQEMSSLMKNVKKEAFIPTTGRGVQGATSHCLGQNFAKIFEINFEDEKGEKAMVWQNSWAYSTRTIGVMVMVHGDDKGLVLPPKVAAVQVIVVHVPYKGADVKEIINACSATVKTLCEAGIRAEADLRENYSPGWKYSHWEMKGVSLRIEIGPKDLANNQTL